MPQQPTPVGPPNQKSSFQVSDLFKSGEAGNTGKRSMRPLAQAAMTNATPPQGAANGRMAPPMAPPAPLPGPGNVGPLPPGPQMDSPMLPALGSTTAIGAADNYQPPTEALPGRRAPGNIIGTGRAMPKYPTTMNFGGEPELDGETMKQLAPALKALKDRMGGAEGGKSLGL